MSLAGDFFAESPLDVNCNGYERCLTNIREAAVRKRIDEINGELKMNR